MGEVTKLSTKDIIVLIQGLSHEAATNVALKTGVIN